MADIQIDSSAADTEKAEPAISTGAVVTGATILIDGMILFGVPVAEGTKLYLLGAITFLAPMITSAIIRFKVWSPRAVARMVEAHKVQLADKQREADQANTEAVAAKAAVTAVQNAIPAAMQSALAHRPQQAPPVRPPSTPAAVPQRPAEPTPAPPPAGASRRVPDRVYGLYNGPDPSTPLKSPTRVQRAVERPSGPPTEPDNQGFYRYSEDELEPRRRPRGYDRQQRRRHALPDETG